MSQSDDGVLVEWPNGGVSVMPVAGLSLIRQVMLGHAGHPGMVE